MVELGPASALGSVVVPLGLIQLLEMWAAPVWAWATFVNVTIKPPRSVSRTNRKSRRRFKASNLLVRGIQKRAYIASQLDESSRARCAKPADSHRLSASACQQ